MTGRWERGCVTVESLWKSEEVGCGCLAGEGAGGREWGRPAGDLEGMGPAGEQWRGKVGCCVCRGGIR